MNMRPKHESSILAFVVVLAFGIYGVCAEGVDNGPMGGLVDAVDSNGGQGPHVAEGVKLYKPRPKPHPLRKLYPELFPETAEAVVVSFTTDWCSPCKRQKAILKGQPGYAIVIVNAETEERWRELSKQWKLGSAVPVTVVVENGEVTKKFVGLQPWRNIEPHAKKAKHEKAKLSSGGPGVVRGPGPRRSP
jgi:glutaredoxin